MGAMADPQEYQPHLPTKWLSPRRTVELTAEAARHKSNEISVRLMEPSQHEKITCIHYFPTQLHSLKHPCVWTNKCIPHNKKRKNVYSSIFTNKIGVHCEASIDYIMFEKINPTA